MLEETWIHLLAYNLIREAMAHQEEPRRLNFEGALQAMSSFRESLQWARGRVRALLREGLLRVIASYTVEGRPNRVGPRAIKRRPKPHKLQNEPRGVARHRLIKSTNGHKITEPPPA